MHTIVCYIQNALHFCEWVTDSDFSSRNIVFSCQYQKSDHLSWVSTRIFAMSLTSLVNVNDICQMSMTFDHSPQINWDETDFEKNRKFRFFSSKNQFFFRFFWKSQFFWKNYTFVVFSFKNDFNRFFEIYIMKNIKKTHFDASEIFWSQNVKKLFAIKKIKNWLFSKKTDSKNWLSKKTVQFSQKPNFDRAEYKLFIVVGT